jgi:hypothetical protein
MVAENSGNVKGEKSFNKNSDNDIFMEVDKFLEEKRRYITESIIGLRTLEELDDYTLDVGIKKTYLCIKVESEQTYETLAKIVEMFIKAYGGTVTIYPKGERVCLELITPKRGL